ncbi:MAG: amino acid racemase [Synergistaceae bacterium]|nr:amino acid racemase [Synergistaceae bacterium]
MFSEFEIEKIETAKTLGVLGGMGPAATAEFLRILARDTPAQRDQDHPRILLLSDPSIPDRTEAILGLGDDPTPLLRLGLERLVQWGADVLAVPCNTAHSFIDRFRRELTVPFIHIVEATVAAAKEKSPEGAWILSTWGTRRSGLYDDYARRAGYRFLTPSDPEQERVQESLTYVKAGKMPEAGRVLREVVEKLWEREDTLVVTACTELPLAYAASGLPQGREISSLQALSDACIAFLGHESV